MGTSVLADLAVRGLRSVGLSFLLKESLNGREKTGKR
jgi:AAA+ ATPase superfamily predicted ATPase